MYDWCRVHQSYKPQKARSLKEELIAESNIMVASLYGTQEESKSIWVYLEQEGGVLEGVSLELLGHGRALAHGFDAVKGEG